MTNALQANQSTVVGGLGTESFTVTTAGFYTLSFKSFIPYSPAGTPAQTASPVQNVDNITTVADSSGSLNNTYWTFNSTNNLQGFYVWYNINSAGTDPAVSGLTGIEVDGATGASANTLATATRAAIAANTAAASYVTVSGATSHVILSQINAGQTTAAADSTSATGFTFSNTTAGSYGTPAGSGLAVVLKQNSTVKGRFSFPSPTQPILGGSVQINASVNDTISIVFSSLSTADNSLNAVKSIVNLFQGLGA